MIYLNNKSIKILEHIVKEIRTAFFFRELNDFRIENLV